MSAVVLEIRDDSRQRDPAEGKEKTQIRSFTHVSNAR